jgi:F-type H+-transporting ATPase subunit b
MFLQLDGTFVVQLINFAIFFALLNVLFLRPVSRAIRKRREYIHSVTSDYDAYQAQATALRAQAEDIRSAARREAEAIITKARAESSNETAALATEYSAKAQAAIESAQATAARELQAARSNEAAIVSQLADLMLSRTISESAR